MFKELLTSVQEGSEILQNKKNASKRYKIKDPNVKKIRGGLGLSQSKFARLLGISVFTLRNWEQGRRQPQGPAKILLHVAAKYPEILPDIVFS